MDEISAKLQEIVDEHGPRSVAVYVGMGTVPFVISNSIAGGWLKGLGSSMFFTAGSIDKPGILIALAHHGMWQAGQRPFAAAAAWLLVGINPVISKSPGFPGQNPGRVLKDMQASEAKLIVIDPRASETAKRAHIHMQPRAGEDPTILAAMIRVILAEDLVDRDFVVANTKGLDALRDAVEPFTPEYAAERAGIEASQIVEAARIFAGAKNAGVSCGTGPSFATHSTLTEYLALCLATLCGHWAREGEVLAKPNVLLPGFTARAALAGLPGLGLRTETARARPGRLRERSLRRRAVRRDPDAGVGAGEGFDSRRRQPDDGLARSGQGVCRAECARSARHHRHRDDSHRRAFPLRHRA